MGELTRAVQNDLSRAMPPPAGTGVKMLACQHSPRSMSSSAGGGTLLKQLRADSSGGEAVTGSAENLRERG